MAERNLTRCIVAAVAGLLMHSAASAKMPVDNPRCGADQATTIPSRPSDARTGSAFARDIMSIGGKDRDEAVVTEVLSGNVPAFLRRLQPVTLSGARQSGSGVEITICVTPDYLAVGSNADFLRVPMGLPAASSIADAFGFMLPTKRMVDAIYAEAAVKLVPSPMPPTAQMTSTDYFLRHNETIKRERAATGRPLGELTAGQKKDIVLTDLLRAKRGQVAIYGWHKAVNAAIQPLSTVHGAAYADYSHGVRLVAPTAYVNGVPMRLADILQDARLGTVLNDQRPIPDPLGLQASLHRGWPSEGFAADSGGQVLR